MTVPFEDNFGCPCIGDPPCATCPCVPAPATVEVVERDYDRMVEILTGMVKSSNTPCWFDHHGCCQEHGWFGEPGECGFREARELLGLNHDDR